MTDSLVDRRDFNRMLLLSLTSAVAGGLAPATVLAQAHGGPTQASRRVVNKQLLPGEPQREIVLVEVTYPPGTGSPKHTHANGVMAYVVSGSIASQVDEEAERTYQAGESWWEPPGALHRVSRNAGSTESAVLLAIYVAPKGAQPEDLMKPV